MTWKSTAAASGLMVIATWLASYAPVGGPPQSTSAPPSVARTETAAAEIQREADRLHGRLQQVTAYRSPARNPFRFSAPQVRAPRPHREPVMTIEDVPAPAAPAQPTLRLMLSGIAEDVAGEEVVRTAIISTPDDVHLVKIGETIGGVYKVTKIDTGMVELVRLDDGSAVQLLLKP